MHIAVFIVVAVFITGVTYGLILQLQKTLELKNSGRTDEKRRVLIGNVLVLVAHAGFLISFILNVLVYLRLIYSQTLTSEITNTGCLIFLIMYMISKYAARPEKPEKTLRR